METTRPDLAELRRLLEAATKTFDLPLKWDGREVERCDGEPDFVYIPQGSQLGSTGIVVDCTHEHTAAICDFLAGMANAADWLIRAAEERDKIEAALLDYCNKLGLLRDVFNHPAMGDHIGLLRIHGLWREAPKAGEEGGREQQEE